MEAGGGGGRLSTMRAVLAIMQWWGFNVTVIITNKWIFQNLDFKFPLTVSWVHFVCSSIGAYVAIHVLKAKPLIQVEPEDRRRRIFPMSFIFCANIVLGNVSLRYIPVSFMQTVKSFTPATTVYYMAPFATMILALPAMLLEGGSVIDWFYTHDSIFPALVIILGSGVLAFCLNFSIFYVIHSTTAVTFNVAGNFKVAVAVLVSWLIFRNPISPMNAIGCAITLVGCTFYGYVRHLICQQQAAYLGNPRTNSPRSRVEMLPLVGDKQDKV
uniref:Uncharacterized protein n=1 Tax=Avena sativa TaxID=4498 RepID=A0ACD5X9I1_AVESA